MDADLGELTARGGPGGDLDVHGDPDAQRHHVARGAAAGLLGSQLVVARLREREVEGAAVVAAVVGRPDRGGDGLGERRDEVAPPHLHRVHPDLHREQIHGPLDRGRRLGPARAAVRDDGRGVGHHRGRVALDAGDVVDAGGHHAREVRQHGAHLRVAARVLQHGEAVRLDLPVAAAADLHELHLRAAVAHRDHVLRARLVPADRAPEATGQPGDEQLLRVGAGLGAEAATHVRRDDPHLLGRQPEDLGEAVANAVRVLRRDEHVEAALAVPRGRRASRLHRARGDALVQDLPAGHDLAAVEERFVAAEVELDRAVRAVLREQHRGIGGRRLGVDDHLERLVVGPYELRRVLALIGALGDDDRDRLAHEAHGAGGEDRTAHRPRRHPGRHRADVEVRRGEDGEHAGRAQRVLDVDGERRMRGGRAHEGREGGAVEQRVGEVGDVRAADGEEPRVLGPDDAVAEDAHRWCCPS